ncbi:(Fe-S)-binding protein [Alicyclobacillus tolerans]|uniref:(Fe-S)-binding protein n=1 Tax=Alicyclobacillus tolerans TaxID=90970 RepID=UPI001F1859DD|nr:(Fe-S)-binding protein [Alicyclobacillus tolerans]MCF8566549.1 (Fe-S)-binding protein [Alicyclobacillus tolerans]
MSQIVDKFDMDELLNCMHCGFCLPTCPTYQQTGLETYSPRGRIALMKGVAEQKLPVDEEFEHNMYACLGCRACETACPAGVKYGHLIETAREVVEETKKARRSQSFTRKLVFKQLFNHPKRIQAVGTALWALQVSGLQKLAKETGLMRILPREMAEMQEAVDLVASPATRSQRQAVVKPQGQQQVAFQTTIASAHLSRNARRDTPNELNAKPMRIGLFTGCIMDVMFYETNQAMAKLLSKAGCEVVFVQDQVCCGALHAHSGEKSDAIELAKRNIAALEQANVDVMVNNAGGCGAALKEYDHWLKDDPDWAERARVFVSKMRDVNELLAELPPLEFTQPVHARVTYQDSCHLAHGQGIRKQPRDLIRSIPGVEFVELPFADSCCGSAGIYNITNFDMSMRILDDKMEHVRGTKTHIVVTANPGCLLQMKKGIHRAGLEGQMEAVHIVDLLNRAL